MAQTLIDLLKKNGGESKTGSSSSTYGNKSGNTLVSLVKNTTPQISTRTPVTTTQKKTQQYISPQLQSQHDIRDKINDFVKESNLKYAKGDKWSMTDWSNTYNQLSQELTNVRNGLSKNDSAQAYLSSLQTLLDDTKTRMVPTKIEVNSYSGTPITVDLDLLASKDVPATQKFNTLSNQKMSNDRQLRETAYYQGKGADLSKYSYRDLVAQQNMYDNLANSRYQNTVQLHPYDDSWAIAKDTRADSNAYDPTRSNPLAPGKDDGEDMNTKLNRIRSEHPDWTEDQVYDYIYNEPLEDYTVKQTSPLAEDSIFTSAKQKINTELKSRDWELPYAQLYLNKDFNEGSQYKQKYTGEIPTYDAGYGWGAAGINGGADWSSYGNFMGAYLTMSQDGKAVDDLFYEAVNGNENAYNFLHAITGPDWNTGIKNAQSIKDSRGYVLNGEEKFMTQDEIDMFDYLYDSPEYGKAAAMEYFDGLLTHSNNGNPSLKARMSQAIEEGYEAWAERDPIAANVQTALTKPIDAGISSVAQLYELVTTGSIDADNQIYAHTNKANTVRGKTGEMIADATGSQFLSDAYQGFMSTIDNIYGIAIGSAIGSVFGITGEAANKVSEAYTLGIMSLDSAQSTTLNNIRNGQDTASAIINGFVAGSIEFLTEKIGLDNLFNSVFKFGDKATWISSMAKQVLAEGGEEGLSDILNWSWGAVYDKLTGLSTSEWNREMNAYILENGLAPGDREKAFEHVFANKMVELGTDIAIGGMSALPLGGFESGRQNFQRRTDINRAMTLDTGDLNVDSADLNSVQNLIDKAKRSAPSSNAYKKAAQLQTELDKIKGKPNLYQDIYKTQEWDNKVNDLYDSLQNESRVWVSSTDTDAVNAMIEEAKRLDPSSKAYKKAAKLETEMDKVIGKATPRDTQRLDPYVDDLYEALTEADLNGETAAAPDLNNVRRSFQMDQGNTGDQTAAPTMRAFRMDAKNSIAIPGKTAQKFVPNDLYISAVEDAISTDPVTGSQPLTVTEAENLISDIFNEGMEGGTETAVKAQKFINPKYVRAIYDAGVQARTQTAFQMDTGAINRTTPGMTAFPRSNNLVEIIASGYESADRPNGAQVMRAFGSSIDPKESNDFVKEMTAVYDAAAQNREIPQVRHLSNSALQAAVNAAEMDRIQMKSQQNQEEDLQAEEAETVQREQTPPGQRAFKLDRTEPEYTPIEKTDDEIAEDYTKVYNYVDELTDNKADSFAEVMADNYQDGMDADAYMEGAKIVYESAQDGIEPNYISLPEKVGQYLSNNTLTELYKAAVKDIKGGSTYGTEETGNVSVSGSSERIDSQSPAVESGTVAEGTGSAESTGSVAEGYRGTEINDAEAVTARTERSNDRNKYNPTGRIVTAESLGITNGTGSSKVELVELTDNRQTRQLQAIEKKYGVKIVPFAGGDLTFSDGRPARGVYDNGTIYVRMDDSKFTPVQIAKHETGHHLLRTNGESKISQVFTALAKKFGDDFVPNKLIPAYQAALADAEYNEAQINEEIVCDVYGGMNQQEEQLKDLPAMSDLYDRYMEEGGKISQEVLETEDADAAIKANNNNSPKLSPTQKKALENPEQLTEDRATSLLTAAKNGDLDFDTYIPVRAHTPSVVIEIFNDAVKSGKIDANKIQDYPMAMQVDKAYQSMDDSGIVTEEYTAHGLTEQDMIDIIKKLNDPVYMVYQKNKNLAVIVNVQTSQGKRILAAISFDVNGTNNKNPDLMNGFKGGKYNIVVTAFSPTSSYWSDYQSNMNKNGNKLIYKKGTSHRGSESSSLLRVADVPFYTGTVTEDENSVKPKQSLSSKNTIDSNKSIATKTQEDVARDLRRRVERLQTKVDYFKGQTRLSALTPGSAAWKNLKPLISEGTAKKILKTVHDFYGSTADIKDMIPEIQRLATYLATRQDSNTFDDVNRMLLPIAKKLVENTQMLIDDDGSQILKDIRNTTIKISTRMQSDISTDFNDWKKQHFGKLRISFNSGEDITEFYQDLTERYGESAFPSDIQNGADQLLYIADFVDNYTPITQNPYSYDMAALVQDAAFSLYNEILNAEIFKPTYADKQKARMDAMKKESAERLKEVRKAATQAKNEQIDRIRKHNKEVREEQRKKRELRDVTKEVMWRGKRLQNLKTTKANRALIDQILGDMNFDVQSLTDGKKAKLEELLEWCREQEQNNPNFVVSDYVTRELEKLNAKYISQIAVDDENGTAIEKLTRLNEALKELDHMIKHQNALINSNEKRNVFELGSQILADINNAKGTNKGVRRKMDTLIVQNTLSPTRFTHRLTGYNDSDPLYQAVEGENGLAGGQRKALDYQYRAGKLFEEWVSDKKFMRWFTGTKAEILSYDLITADGKEVTIQMTPAMRTTLYLASMDKGWMEHMCGTDSQDGHAAGGGIVLPDIKSYRKGNISDAYDSGTTKVRLTKSFLTKLGTEMTQQEREFATAIHDYFNGMSKDSINATSEMLIGRSIAEVGDYLPISVDKNFLGGEYGAIKYDGTIEGMGNLKERQSSKKPVIVRDITDILKQSIDSTSKYVGLAIPISNFNKLMGVTVGHVDEKGVYQNFEGSVLESIANKWGKNAQTYIENMISDLQMPNNSQEDIEKAFERIRSKYAGAVLTLNLSVAMKQAASYPTAAAILGWKPLAQAFTNVTHVDLDFISKWTPLLWYRTQGYSTSELGDIKNQNNLFTKISNTKGLKWMNMIQGVDVKTTTKLWKAAEFYVRNNNPELYQKGAGERGQSDAFYKAVADIYNKTIEETQPNYTALQRPAYLRSKSGVTRTLMMFKTQPMQNFNVIYDAVGDFQAKRAAYKNNSESAEAQEAYKESGKRLRRAVSSQIGQLVTFAAMTMLWNMFRRKKEKYTDEEGNFSWEKIAESMGKDIGSGLFGMMPLGSEVWSFVSAKAFGDKYYGFESVTDSALGDFASACSTLWDTVGNIIDGEEELNITAFKKKLKTILSSASKILGVPFDNLYNTVTAGYMRSRDIVDGLFHGNKNLADYWCLSWTEDASKDKGEFYDILYKAYQDGVEGEYETILDLMINSGEYGTDDTTPEEDIAAGMQGKFSKDVSGGDSKQGVYDYLYSIKDTDEYEKAYNDALFFGYNEEDIEDGMRKSFAADLIGVSSKEFSKGGLYEYLYGIYGTADYNEKYKKLTENGFTEKEITDGLKKAYGISLTGKTNDNYKTSDMYDKLYELQRTDKTSYNKEVKQMQNIGFKTDDIESGVKAAAGREVTGITEDYSSDDLYKYLYNLQKKNKSSYNSTVSTLKAAGYTDKDITDGIKKAYGEDITGKSGEDYSTSDLYTYVYKNNKSNLSGKIEEMKEYGYTEDGIKSGLKSAYGAELTGMSYDAVRTEDVYNYVYNLYTTDSAKFATEYQNMINVGYTEKAIKTGIEDRLKTAYGVDNVKKLPYRFAAPEHTLPSYWTYKTDDKDEGPLKDDGYASGSSWIGTYYYNNGELTVYENGVPYTYHGVSEEVYENFKKSSSKGSFVNSTLRGYSYSR